MTLDDMTTVLLGMFDVPLATAQGWVQEAYRQAATDAQWFTENLTIASTTSGQADYPLPANLVHLRSLFVGGTEYMRIGDSDMPSLQVGNVSLPIGQTGAFAQSSSSAGVDQVTLFPTPTATGTAVTGKAELVPADLVTGGGAGSAPVFPADLHPLVLDGAIAIGYLRADERPDLAGTHEQRYQAGVAKLRARKISRVSGRGPFRAAVQGYDFGFV